MKYNFEWNNIFLIRTVNSWFSNAFRPVFPQATPPHMPGLQNEKVKAVSLQHCAKATTLTWLSASKGAGRWQLGNMEVTYFAKVTLPGL